MYRIRQRTVEGAVMDRDVAKVVTMGCDRQRTADAICGDLLHENELTSNCKRVWNREWQ